MSSSIASKINSSSSYPTIIEDIVKLLGKKKKKFQSSQSEIVVKDSTKKEIVEIISSLIAKDDLSLVLEVVETKKSVYIRKKVSTK